MYFYTTRTSTADTIGKQLPIILSSQFNDPYQTMKAAGKPSNLQDLLSRSRQRIAELEKAIEQYDRSIKQTDADLNKR